MSTAALEFDRPPYRLAVGSGAPGVLLLHGLTASPTEVRPLAEAIAQLGTHHVLAPLLPGHGTSPRELAQTSGEDWLRAARAASQQLAGECGALVVGGVSMGAVLAARLAIEMSAIRGTILLAPMFTLPARKRCLLRALSAIKSEVRKSRASLENHRRAGLISYDRYPIRSLFELHRLGRNVWSDLPQLRGPVLLAGGRLDRYIPARAWQRTKERMGRANVEFIGCPASGHVLPHEPDAPMLVERIIRFIDRCTGSVEPRP